MGSGEARISENYLGLWMSTEARTVLYVQSIYVKISTASNAFLCMQSTGWEETMGDLVYQ